MNVETKNVGVRAGPSKTDPPTPFKLNSDQKIG